MFQRAYPEPNWLSLPRSFSLCQKSLIVSPFHLRVGRDFPGWVPGCRPRNLLVAQLNQSYHLKFCDMKGNARLRRARAARTAGWGGASAVPFQAAQSRSSAALDYTLRASIGAPRRGGSRSEDVFFLVFAFLRSRSRRRSRRVFYWLDMCPSKYLLLAPM